MIYITKRFHFSASHRVYNAELTNEENFKLYGNCSNPNWHGHNYVLEVTVAGEVDRELGYLMDLKELKKTVDETIIEKVDHRNLNIDVDFMKGIIPSSENIAVKFWNELEDRLTNPNAKLYSVKLFETENNFVEYKGNKT
jgi:6-pyruvoyltetrahydropterin/6-carboxytetrahydropterin synthase